MECQKVRSLCESICVHMQSRGGSCSELSRLQSENVSSITTFITSKLTNSRVCCTCLFCFLQSELPGNICGSSFITLRTFTFILFFSSPFHLSCHSTLLVCPLMRCNSLFFLHVTCQLSTSHRQISHRTRVECQFKSIISV